jgi:hypothetical protein
MILHESPDAFREAVEVIAQSLNLRPIFVEKKMTKYLKESGL